MRALDGSPSTEYSSGSCISTEGGETNARWAADLGWYSPNTVCKVEKSSHLTEDFSTRTQSRHFIQHFPYIA